MIVLDVVCRARVHESDYARQRGGCVCPVAWGEPFRRSRRTWRPEYIPGRVHNLYGPRRCTVDDPDEVAVERAAGGDRALVLAAIERDLAIDTLDRVGLSAAQVARRLGVTVRTVQRRRRARQLAGAA